MSPDTLAEPNFSLDAAILLAEASHAAYEDELKSEVWAAENGFLPSTKFERSNIQGFWSTSPNGEVAVLAFRGTSNIGQWLRDARFFPVSHPWGRVHAGFYAGVREVELDLVAFDVKAKAAKHVWITGHSLGGALAVIAAARLKMQGLSARLFTYGQPRVSLSGFADRFAIELPGALYRFVNQSDIVARVPPGLLYAHTGRVKRIVRPGVLQTEKATAALVEMGLDSTGVQALHLAAGLAALESAEAVEAAGLSSPSIIETDLPALSEEQYAALQLALANGTAPVSAGGAGLEMAELEGALPFISNHSITEYIRLLIEIRS